MQRKFYEWSTYQTDRPTHITHSRDLVLQDILDFCFGFLKICYLLICHNRIGDTSLLQTSYPSLPRLDTVVESVDRPYSSFSPTPCLRHNHYSILPVVVSFYLRIGLSTRHDRIGDVFLTRLNVSIDVLNSSRDTSSSSSSPLETIVSVTWNYQALYL